MSSIRRNLPAIGWVTCVALLVAALTFRIAEGQWLRSNVFDLLPPSEYDPVTAKAVGIAERELSGRLFFLVGHTDREVARRAADRLASGLAESPLIDDVNSRTSGEQATEIGTFYFNYRRELLTDRQIEAIESDGGAAIEQTALATLFGPLGATSGSMLTSDPFGLFQDAIAGLQGGGTALTFDDEYLWAVDGDMDYAFLSARTVYATLDMGSQARLVDRIERLIGEITAANPGLEVLKTGFLFYSDAGTKSASSEVSTIGVGSLLGVLVLILWLFRSARPLWLGLLTIASGCLLAVTVTVWSFGSIHLFTLVFGASLIGVSIDYTFHYLADEFLGGPDWTPGKGLSHIFPGITLGLVTSAVAYLALTVAPFPGLKQLAVFSASGLVGAYLTLLCCAGWFRTASVPGRRPRMIGACAAYLDLWRRMPRAGAFAIVAAVGAVAAAGLVTLKTNDDVAELQSRPDELSRQESEIARLTAAAPSNTFLLVRSPSEEALLEREEDVRVTLDRLVAARDLNGYIAVSQSVPSAKRQRQSRTAYDSLIRTRLPGFYATIGLTDEAARDALAKLTAAGEPLTLDNWLAHPVSEELKRLWIGDVGGEFASIILLEGVRDQTVLASALDRYEGVAVVDKARDLSSLLGAYRVRISWLLVAGYGVILALLAFRYGTARGLVLLVPPVLAGLLALGLVSLFGATINLFHLVALILVLGIGIDFTIFIAESRHALEGTLLAITLSAITTLLSFGLLSLSATYAVQSFGSVVLIGIACSYLLAPMALSAREPEAA